jgi:hypothetical protein
LSFFANKNYFFGKTEYFFYNKQVTATKFYFTYKVFIMQKRRSKKYIEIIGFPMDLGSGRRGVDM